MNVLYKKREATTIKLAKRIPRKLLLSWSILPVLLVPSVVFADKPAKSPPLAGVPEARKIGNTIAITVEGHRPERFFEQYIFAKTHTLDFAAVLAESEEPRRISSGLSDLAKSVTASFGQTDWKQDHIGIAIPF